MISQSEFHKALDVTDEYDLQYRIAAKEMLANGVKVKAIGKLLGVSKPTIDLWSKYSGRYRRSYKDHGLVGLRNRKPL